MRFYFGLAAALAVAAVLFSGLPRQAAGLFGLAAAEGSDPPAPAGGSMKGANSGPPPVRVEVASAAAGSLPVLRRTVGTVVPVASTALSSLAAGTIAEIRARDGAEVKAGDVIARLDDRAVRAALDRDIAAVARDQAALDNARSALARAQNLMSTGNGTQQARDDASTTEREAEATLALDRATMEIDQVALDNTTIRAPFDGRLGAVLLSQGAYVAPGTPIVTLTQMRPVHVEFSLPDTDLLLIRSALSAGRLTVAVRPLQATGGSADAVTGTVRFIDNTVDRASGTVTLRAELANGDDELWPGQPLDVEATLGQLEDLVIVPSVAVQPGAAGPQVYVVAKDGTVARRPVTIALRSGDRIGLAGGLAGGESVVTEGQLTLTDGARVTADPGTGAAP